MEIRGEKNVGRREYAAKRCGDDGKLLPKFPESPDEDLTRFSNDQYEEKQRDQSIADPIR